MKTNVKNGDTVNGMKVRKNVEHPGYWDVICPVRNKPAFTGTLKEIRAIRPAR